ncbi:hypothetical protein K523DRAFT_422385, partial [Schizophyllum commune Tattone D]
LRPLIQACSSFALTFPFHPPPPASHFVSLRLRLPFDVGFDLTVLNCRERVRRHRQAHSRPPRRRLPEDASDTPDVAFDTSSNDRLVIAVGGCRRIGARLSSGARRRRGPVA